MRTYFILISLSIVFLTGCTPNQPENIIYMKFIDSLSIHGQTDSTLVLLQNLEKESLTEENQKYMDLIQLIIESDQFSNIDSDTALIELANHYSKQPVNEEYIRSLLYLGIVSNKLQMADTFVYQTLKLAENLVTTKLEKQYNYSMLEMSALKQKQQLHKIIFSISIVAILLALFIFIFRYKLRQKSFNLEEETLMRQIAESWTVQISKENAQKEQLLNLYHQLTQRHAATQEHLEQLSYRFIKENPSIHDAVQTELQALKNEFNKILNEIVHEDLFYSYFNIPKEIPLTAGEKIILFLLHCDLNSKQLSTMMGINQGSLRVRKSNLRRKLIKLKNQYPNIENVLDLL